MIEYIAYAALALSIAVIIAMGIAIRNLLKQIDVYEDWVELFRSEASKIYDRLKMVDDKNLFEKDDDVGFVFSEILRVVKEFNDTIK